MTRFEAFLLLRRRVRDRRVVQRCLAVEALMEDLAPELGGEPERWGLAGLLCEVDHEFTENNPRSKGTVAADIVRADGAPPDVVSALQGFREPGPHADPLTRALSAALPAVRIVLDLAASRAELEGQDPQGLEAGIDDPSVAPEASRTRIQALAGDGLDTPALLAKARASILRVAEDVFGP